MNNLTGSPVVKILLIEDDEDDAYLVKQMLLKIRRWRHELVWASGYMDGIRLFESGSFSVILVDYHLGEYTGLDVVREISQKNGQVPIIFLTGDENYDLDLNAMQAGAVDYLTKTSLAPPLLERSIRYAIERKQAENRLQKEAKRAELLANLSRDFTEAGLDYRGLLITISRRISDTFGDASIIRILADDQESLLPAAVYHPDPEARKLMEELITATPQRIGEGIVGAVALTQEPVLKSGSAPLDWTGATHLEYQSWLERYPFYCMFSLPLCSSAKLIGTVTILRSRPDQPFTPEEQNFFIDLSNRAAMSIENAMLHQEVERLALTDPLTGLFNRRGFFKMGKVEFERHRRYGSPLSVIMMDIDQFKYLNDTYGHDFGDRVLQALSDSCTSNIRSMDIAVRYGGDEFLILLPEINELTAGQVAERIRACFAGKKFPAGNETVELTISLGVSSALDQVHDMEDLIRHADQALYRSKQKGRNRVEIG